MSRTPLFANVSAVAVASVLTAMPALAGGPNFLSNVIVDGSLCVGNDCVAGTSFGFDTIRLRENNLRIHFEDTSTSASFPTNDWRITINDSANGGGSYFAVEDSTAGRQVFKVEAGAPSNSLYVDNGGRLGVRTSNPVVEIHAVDGDTPTLRLAQDGSSGFTPQTFDVAANETNFFIRDVTNGSTLPFRIKPGAPTNSIYIDDDGSVGMGTQNPDRDLHVLSTSSTDALEAQFENSAGGAVQMRLITTNGNNRAIVGLSVSGTTQSAIKLGDDQLTFTGNAFGTAYMTVNSDGAELPAGAAFSVAGTDLNVPDYVFAPDYPLMPLTEVSAFIAENSHLPNVPSAADINAGSLNMTQMQLTLLEKVEELTLYTLQQQDEINTLRQELLRLK